MTNPSVLLELAGRVEVLMGPDREADCLIWCYVNGLEPTWQGTCLVAGIEGVIGWIDPGEHQRNFTTNRLATGPGSIPAYTASIDAAMSLVDPAWWVDLSAPMSEAAWGYAPEHERKPRAGLQMIGAPYSVGSRAATLPLALAAACLRALAAREG